MGLAAAGLVAQISAPGALDVCLDQTCRLRDERHVRHACGDDPAPTELGSSAPLPTLDATLEALGTYATYVDMGLRARLEQAKGQGR